MQVGLAAASLFVVQQAGVDRNSFKLRRCKGVPLGGVCGRIYCLIVSQFSCCCLQGSCVRSHLGRFLSRVEMAYTIFPALSSCMAARLCIS